MCNDRELVVNAGAFIPVRLCVGQRTVHLCLAVLMGLFQANRIMRDFMF